MKGKLPFNVSLPDSAVVFYGPTGTPIGYAYPSPSPMIRLDPDLRKSAPKNPRWTAVLLDGTVVTRNAVTRRRAKAAVMLAIRRRVPDKCN